MPATVTVRRYTGTAASPTKTDVTGISTLHNLDDAHFASAPTYPITIPAASSTLGWWVSVRFQADTTPTTIINNLKTYFDGTSGYPAGVTLTGQAANVGADAGYRQATGTPGTSGTTLNTTNHTGLTGAPVDVFTWTAASPKTLAGSIANPSTGAFGDFVVSQMAVASTTTATGIVTAETETFLYDES